MTKRLSILLVDDNPSIAIALTDVLELKDFTVHLADSGKKALALLKVHPVDVMITDVIMTEMNGLELYQATKKIYPKLITMFMTAYAAEDLIQQGLKEGIKTVLNKPVDMDFLILLLKSFEDNLAE